MREKSGKCWGPRGPVHSKTVSAGYRNRKHGMGDETHIILLGRCIWFRCEWRGDAVILAHRRRPTYVCCRWRYMRATPIDNEPSDESSDGCNAHDPAHDPTSNCTCMGAALGIVLRNTASGTAATTCCGSHRDGRGSSGWVDRSWPTGRSGFRKS